MIISRNSFISPRAESSVTTREIKHKHRVMSFAGYGIQLAEILPQSIGESSFTHIWIGFLLHNDIPVHLGSHFIVASVCLAIENKSI